MHQHWLKKDTVRCSATKWYVPMLHTGIWLLKVHSNIYRFYGDAVKDTVGHSYAPRSLIHAYSSCWDRIDDWLMYENYIKEASYESTKMATEDNQKEVLCKDTETKFGTRRPHIKKTRMILFALYHIVVVDICQSHTYWKTMLKRNESSTNNKRRKDLKENIEKI